MRRPQELLNLNIIKGATEVIGSQTLMGRAMVTIKQFADEPGQKKDQWCAAHHHRGGRAQLC